MRKTKPLRAAVYTRFSTEKQSSTAAQLQVCRDICRREHFKVVATFADEAISGGTSRRPAYQALMAAARTHQFDVIVAEDTSRLWRNMAHQWPALKELQDLGIHVVGHGLDTRREDSTLSLAVQGAMNDAYRAEIGRRTKRSLVERAREGRLTGGRAYGYRIEKGQRVIEPKEAAIVRQIFQWRADGWSALRIARHLNTTKSPAPGAHWNRTSGRRAVWRASAIAGDPKRGIGLLNNELYRGNVIWNRFHWVRGAADSDIRKFKLRSRNEWFVQHYPKLRIVPDALWLHVQKLQTQDSPKAQAIRRGIKKSVWQSRPKWWLSGILACAACKSNLQINGHDYICPTAHAGKCENKVRVKKAAVEAEVLALLRADLLDPKRMRSEVKRVEKYLRQREAIEAEEARRSIDGTELRRIEREMRDVTKLSIGATAKDAALAALRAERDALKALPAGASGQARKVLAQLPNYAKDFEKQIAAALTDGAGPDIIEDARAATTQLINGGKIYVRAKKQATEARLELLGLGAFVVRIANPGGDARPIGSGGTLRSARVTFKHRARRNQSRVT